MFVVSCRLFELYGHEDNIKCVWKDFPLQDVGPQKCMAFSVDGSKLATGGVVSNLVKDNVFYISRGYCLVVLTLYYFES